VIWLTPGGTPMQHDDWTRAETRTLGLLLLGKRLAERDDRGEPVEDDDLLLLLHAGESAIEFKLPDEGWTLVLDTAAAGRGAANPYYLQPRTFALLVKAK